MFFWRYYMPLVKAQCTNCGATLEVDNTKDAAMCPYCKTPYIVEKAINNYTTNITNNIQAQTVNIINKKDDYEIVAGTLIKYTGKSADLVIPDDVTAIDKEAIPKNIRSVVLPNGITSISEGTFSLCRNLTSITIPASVTGIGDTAFFCCDNLTSITVLGNVTYIGPRAFIGCNKIKTITANVEVAVAIGQACFSPLVSSNFSVNIISSKKIDSWAFTSCLGLTSIRIPASVTSISPLAFHNGTLSRIVVDNNNKVYDSRNNCNAIIETKTNTLIVGCKNTIIPSNIEKIGSVAFANCMGLQKITIPNSVKEIGDGAFMDCRNLASVVLPKGIAKIKRGTFYRKTKIIKMK